MEYEVGYLCYEVRLRIGYFKTKQYNMIIAGNKIILSSLSNHDEDITISDIDIIVVSGIENKNSSIEIQSLNSTYLCFLHENINLDELLSTMRKELNNSKAIICN